MKARTLLVLDIPFLYFSTPKGRIQYNMYLEHLKKNLDVRMSIAYTNQQNPTPFFQVLYSLGFEIRQDRECHTYNLIIETLELSNNVDTIVIGSSAKYVPILVKTLKKKGKRVIIFAKNIPEKWNKYCEIIEIPKEYILI